MFLLLLIGFLALAVALILVPAAFYNRSPFIAAALALILVPMPALAASTIVLPAGFMDEINQLIVGIVVALLVLGFKWLDNRSPLKNTQAEQIARDAFNSVLYQGAKYGLTQLQNAEQKVGSVDVGSPAVAAAANFVIAQAPGLAAKMGVDVSTEDGRAAIIRMVTARVGDLMTAPNDPPKPLPLPASVQPPAAPTISK